MSDIRFPVTNIKGKACATSIWLSEDAAFKNLGEAYGQVVKLGLQCFFHASATTEGANAY